MAKCKECSNEGTTGGYCRLHYIKNHAYTRKCTEARKVLKPLDSDLDEIEVEQLEDFSAFEYFELG